ncbi:hypothetical protein TSUD_185450 [Trifolium subterraneum]|uniref:Sugar phosphate transporter domain-containing protein n=1 Tax=Trifolium subterraneum TaxID=3900 RepID=A0A2Z6PDY4_TRISU|nr:hypothetical protein TSUD_185450 [Trifolium subterraneum]
MQATLLPLTPSLSLYKSQSSLSSSLSSTFNPSFSSSSWKPLVSSYSSSKLISLTPLYSSNHLQTKAATTTAAADSSDSSESSSLFKALELGILFCLWFTFNIYFNIYNKQVLKVYHLPVTLTAVQFAIGTLLVAFMWGLNLYKRPKLTSSQLLAIFPLALVHTLGNLFTNMSLGMESVDNITLFSIITVMSFFLSLPLAIFMEGVKFTPTYLQSAGLDVQQVYMRSLLAALCFHAYQQVAYMILERVSPVTHSVANCLKRVIVIVSSVIFFQTPVSPINALGTGIALSGVFLYSRVTRIKPKTD